MTTQQFFKQLTTITLGTALVLVALHFLFTPAQMHGKFAQGTVVVFYLLSIGLFFLGRNAILSGSKYAFNNIIMLSVFGKMALSLAILFMYREEAKPENSWYVFIFFIVYVVFTVFEVGFMSKLGKMKP